MLLKRWVPLFILVCTVLATILIWQALATYERSGLDDLLTMKTAAVKDDTRDNMEYRIEALVRLAKRWEEKNNPDPREWDADASLYISPNLGYKSILWINPDLTLRYASPDNGIDRDAVFGSGPAREAFIRARDTRAPVLSGVIKIRDKGSFVIFIPLYRDGEFTGVIGGLYEGQELFKNLYARSLHEFGKYSVAVSSGNDYLYGSDEEQKGGPVHTALIDLPGAAWTVAVSPRPELLKEAETYFDELVLAIGLLTSILLSSAVFFAQESSKKGRKLETVNLTLKAEIEGRKKIEERLRESDEKFRNLVETTSDFIWEIDENAVYTYASPKVTDILGYGPEELIGKTPFDFMPLPEAERVKSVFGPIAASQKPFALLENTNKRKDGRLVVLETSGAPVFDKAGRFAGYRGVDREITKRKLAEESLKRSQASLTNAQRIAHIGSWNWDIERDEFKWSDEIYRIFGVEPQEFGATYEAFLGFVHPEDRQAVHKCVSDSLKLKKPYSIEHRIVLANGAEKVVHEQGEVIFDEHDRPTVMMGTVQDITERKQTEEQLKLYRDHLKELVEERTAELRDVNERLRFEVSVRKGAEDAVARMNEALENRAWELERVNKELEAFTYSASHDLQEPLRVVSGYVQLLSRRYKGKLDKDADEFIAYAVDGVSRMQRLISDLLSYSRVGKAREFAPVDSGAVIKRVISNLKASIEESGAVVSCGDEMPTVFADESQLEQLFTNLISNGIKYRGADTPLIKVFASKENEGWVFSVSDNGIGIEPRYFGRIFELFQRLHGKAEYPGTGIGLSICKKVVENHGGRIWVESLPGEGSIFYFIIPQREAVNG